MVEKQFREIALEAPRLSVLSDNPIMGKAIEQESFNLRVRLGPVYDIIRHPQTQTPLAVAVYGTWGTGKTTAMRWLEGLHRLWNEEGGSCRWGQ